MRHRPRPSSPNALQSDDADAAHGAACGLEVLGGKQGLEMAALALAHADPKVRRAGAFGAYRAHGERALPLMEKALADPDAGVRKMAAIRSPRPRSARYARRLAPLLRAVGCPPLFR